ncbi:peptide chain release factor 2, partial [Candidatus Parcubacteria bacterium]|nr:peptide chain release factor 2 [Candidatus Parcubacteria bacterium]
MQSPDFWNDQKKAAKISQEVSGLKEELQTIEAIEKEFKD